MPGMKVTVDAAMRARDVSRPQPEHDAAAEAAIANMPTLRGAPGARVTPVPAPPARTQPPRGAAAGQPSLPHHRPRPPVPSPASQPAAAGGDRPAPPPQPAVAPRPAQAPQPITAQNAATARPAERREPESRQAQPQPGSPRSGRRKRVRRRRRSQN